MWKRKHQKASVVDVFCGAGGLSFGFKRQGFRVSAGIDIDEACRYPFEKNIDAPFIQKDVATLCGNQLNSLFVPNTVKVLVGCAPCQPFSAYNRHNKNPAWSLLNSFLRLITDTNPEIVSMENVPNLLRFNGGKLFADFIKHLEQERYKVEYDVLFCPDYGLPQARARLVLLASRLGHIKLPTPTHKKNHLTVKDAIGALPPIDAGQSAADDPIHTASELSDLNTERIKSSAPGKTWKDWHDSLISPCHKTENGKKYSSVYGRMVWDKPSPTITTYFYGFSNGRFGHPEQNRALSLREGALLQGFPKNYKFSPAEQPVIKKKIGQLIGNAVPVALAEAIARTIRNHINENRYA